MNIFERFVLFYVSFLPVLFTFLIKIKFSSFFVEVVCLMLFSEQFCRLKGAILLRHPPK